MNRFLFGLLLTSTMCIVIMFTYWSSFSGSVSPPKGPLPSSESSRATTHELVVYDPWLQEQSRRKVALHRACRKVYGKKGKPSVWSMSRRRTNLLSHMVLDDIHEVLYCYLPKIACSNWKKIMMILSGKTTATDPKDESIPNPHMPGAVTTLISNPLKTAAFKLKTYKKFFFVRHPFERLLSAYRNKFESYAESSKHLKEDYAGHIVKGFKMGDPIPFPKFVDYILRLNAEGKRETLNEHWASYDDICHPCHVQYDFMGYYETLMEDADQILYHIGAPSTLRFPTHKPLNTSNLLSQYFKQLSERQIRGLFKVYRNDFILFGYSRNFTFH